jgi:16S rRNA (cytosine1402-N4)-methyltransferase
MEPTDIQSVHRSVLTKEVLESLDLQSSDVVVDATVNGGGHAQEIVSRLGSTGMFIGIDLDQRALQVSEQRLKGSTCPVVLVQGNFKNLDEILKDQELQSIDKILFDLGWSSNQFEDPSRGFSFQHDGPLLMSLSGTPDDVAFTAFDIINNWEFENIKTIIEAYGEERYAWKIVQAIDAVRKERTISSTLDLAEIIKQAVPGAYRNGPTHPATKTFQALRIAVNDEIEVLRVGLQKAFDALGPNGRMSVISFHSIEDRVVKQFFKELSLNNQATILTKKPITASQEELEQNRRSRSAKLRTIQKI